MIYHYECYVECMLIILYIILRIVMTWYGPENTEKGPLFVLSRCHARSHGYPEDRHDPIDILRIVTMSCHIMSYPVIHPEYIISTMH